MSLYKGNTLVAGMPDSSKYAKKTDLDLYDSSNFTITGTPTITNDGWVTGFTDSDRMLATPTELTNITKDNVLEIEFAFKTPSAKPSSSELALVVQNSNRQGFGVQIRADGTLYICGNVTLNVYTYAVHYTYAFDTTYKVYAKINFGDDTATNPGSIYAELKDENDNVLASGTGYGAQQSGTWYYISANNYNGFISVGCSNTTDFNNPMANSYVNAKSIILKKDDAEIFRGTETIYEALDKKVDLDYSNASYTPVNKAGDTMTGALSINNSSANVPLTIQGKITQGTSSYQDIACVNTSNNRVGIIRFQDTGSKNQVQISTMQYGTNTIESGIIVKCDSDGNVTCDLPNSYDIDGQWVSKTSTISTATTLKTYTLSLSSYLPSDSYNYEVWCQVYINRDDTSGANTNISVYDSLSTSYPIIKTTADGANFQQSWGTGLLTINSGREMTLVIEGYAPATAGVYLRKYRRLGTNS